MKTRTRKWAPITLCCLALACAVGSGSVQDEENLDMCLMWGTTLDPESYVAKLEANLIERLASKSIDAKIRSDLRSCLQDTEADFIAETTAHCKTGSLNPDQLSERTTGWTDACIERVFPDA